jgi:hypothetical protein
MFVATGCNSASPEKQNLAEAPDIFAPGSEVDIGSIEDDYYAREAVIKVFFVHSPTQRKPNRHCPRYTNWPNLKLINRFDAPDPNDMLGFYYDQITWEAAKESDPDYTEEFFAVFSPFHVEPSGADGKVVLKGIRPLVLRAFNRGFDVDFKYSIIGDDCRGQPLDPRFRVL